MIVQALESTAFKIIKRDSETTSKREQEWKKIQYKTHLSAAHKFVRDGIFLESAATECTEHYNHKDTQLKRTTAKKKTNAWHKISTSKVGKKSWQANKKECAKLSFR